MTFPPSVVGSEACYNGPDNDGRGDEMIRRFSQTGMGHLSQGKENQDCVLSSIDPDYVIIAAADGVSAARYAKEGAQIACRTVIDVFRRDAESLFACSREKMAVLLLDQILYEIAQQPQGAAAEEFASTLMFACVRRRDGMAILWNLGDGTVLHRSCSGAAYEMSPRRFRGIPCQTVTKGAYRAVQIQRIRIRHGDTILLMTDGVQEAPVMQVLSQGWDVVDETLRRAACRDDASYIALNYRG